MGITGLLPFLRGFQKLGYTRLWLCPYHKVEIDKGEISFMCCFRMYYKTTVQMCKYDGVFHFRLAVIFRKYLLIVKRAGIPIYIVFDGLSLPGKASEVEQRQR
jgi:hypothetical protein